MSLMNHILYPMRMKTKCVSHFQLMDIEVEVLSFEELLEEEVYLLTPTRARNGKVSLDPQRCKE
jgi:hypothetical protein